MSGEKEEDGDELIVTPGAAHIEYCRIYTQCESEGKGAPAAAAEAF